MSDKTKLAPEVVAMAKIIADNVERKDGETPAISKEAFKKTLPEALTEEIVDGVYDHRNTFMAASAQVTAGIALEELTKNKDLKSVTLEVPMHGKDTFAVTVERRNEYPDMTDKSKPPVVKYGQMTTKYTAYESSARVGQVKIVKAEAAERALKLLAE